MLLLMFFASSSRCPGLVCSTHMIVAFPGHTHFLIQSEVPRYFVNQFLKRMTMKFTGKVDLNRFKPSSKIFY